MKPMTMKLFKRSHDWVPELTTKPAERIASRIYLIRGEKVMLDSDLAELYGVPTKILNQAVRRTRDRFPEDFMFRPKRCSRRVCNQ
jgi:hypothetical protein